MLYQRLLTSVAAFFLGAIASHAAPFSWIAWGSPGSQTVSGAILTSNGLVGVTVTGPFFGVLTTYPTWGPASSYADGVLIDNAPDNTSVVQLDIAGSFTVAFDRPVFDLAFSVFSVGSAWGPVTYTFDHTLAFVAGGPSSEFGGEAITTTPTSLTGLEGNGTVLFSGPLTTLSFSTTAENWHGFNLGLKTDQPVPEPITLVTLGLGVAFGRRRWR